MGIKIAVIEPGKDPYTKEIQGTENEQGEISYLSALQDEAGGLIEFFEPLFGDNPALIVNEEFLYNGSAPNRAIYANERIHEMEYLDMMTYSHVPEVGELYGLIMGTFVAVSYDGEGNARDLPADEWEKVWETFSGADSVNSCIIEILRIRGEL